MDQEKNTMTMECSVCQVPVTFVVPQLQVFNGSMSTVLVWGHEKTQVCTQCGTPYQMAFGGFQGVAIQWMPLQRQQERSIILAPANDSKLKIQ